MRVRIASSIWSRARGLLFHSEEWLGDGALLLAPCNSIHTFGMRRYIDVAFVDCKGVVVKVAKGLAPGRVRRCPNAIAVLERFTCSQDLPWDPETAQEWFNEGDNIAISKVK